MKFDFRKLFLVVCFACVILTSTAVAQSNRLKLVFAENGKALDIQNLTVDIVSIKTHKVLQSLAISKDGVEIPSDLASLGNFDVHVSFNQYRLILQNLNWKYFDNKWEVDVREVSPKKVPAKRQNQAKCKKPLRIFRVDFNPSNGEGFWWLIPDCRQSKAFIV